jgi:carbon monoxide dehydrogenase subunit G
MELDHEFTVPVPVDRAWSVLLDVERLAPCVPGATLDSIDGDEFTGRLKVKLGAMTITYKGAAKILVADESTRSVTLEGTGKEARGSGTASVTVLAQLHDEGESTRVTVRTELNVTGRPAQFGRNILSEVGGKLIGRFAKALAEELAADEATPEATAEPTAEPAAEVTAEPAAEQADQVDQVDKPEQADQPEEADRPAAEETPAAARPARERRSEEAINLLEVAGPSIAKRVAPIAVGAVILLVLWWLFRRN